MAETVFFVGGIRSGKSGLAQAWAEACSARRLYVATLRVEDEEMQRRVRRHREARGESWEVLESSGNLVQELQLSAAQRAGQSYAVVVDCLSTWIASMLERLDDAAILGQVRDLCALFPAFPFPLGIVSCEVGTSLVPLHPLGRRFQDLLGEANQLVARACPTVLFVSCGLPLLLRGGSLPCPFRTT